MATKRAFKSGKVLLGHIQLTDKQQKYFEIMTRPDTKIVFLSGPAGTSKSFLSVYCALHLINREYHKKILYLRTAVESAQRSLGFLKGGQEEKSSVYLEILEDMLAEILTPQETDGLKKKNAIEADVINFLRGKSISDTIFIFDEAENAILQEIETVATRMNKNSRIFICGDSRQSDLKKSHYDQVCRLFETEDSEENGIYHLEFTREDIMRDPVIGFFLDKMDELKTN